MLTPLLTPEQVAKLLNLSPKTVYKHKRRLGGFYPAGIGVLRFSPGVIYGVLAGQGQGVEVSLRIAGAELLRAVVPLQGEGEGSPGRTPQAPKTREEKLRLAAELGFRLTDP